MLSLTSSRAILSIVSSRRRVRPSPSVRLRPSAIAATPPSMINMLQEGERARERPGEGSRRKCPLLCGSASRLSASVAACAAARIRPRPVPAPHRTILMLMQVRRIFLCGVQITADLSTVAAVMHSEAPPPPPPPRTHSGKPS